MRKHEFLAIGTQWELLVADQIDESTWKKLLEEIQHCADEFNQRYSRFVTSSWVMNLRAGQTYDLSEQDLSLFTLYEQLNDLSGGLFTPLIGQLLSQAGYDAEYSLQVGSITAIPDYAQVVERRGRQLHVFQDTTLDFGAAGKGYLVDLLGALCERRGIHNYLVDGSGDMRHRQSGDVELGISKKSEISGIRVGLEHPLDQQQAIGVVQLSNQSIAGSASNRRKWGEWHHIVNPRQRMPVREIVATWVIVDQDQSYPTMVADALATALFLVEPKQLAAHFPFDYVIYHQDGTVKASPDFVGELFVASL